MITGFGFGFGFGFVGLRWVDLLFCDTGAVGVRDGDGDNGTEDFESMPLPLTSLFACPPSKFAFTPPPCPNCAEADEPTDTADVVVLADATLSASDPSLPSSVLSPP